uniref:Uncharacterized protein n=1 Tax=Arundo donax TaxID=35708 RepID=A0A0A9D6X4_ARUDO
MNLIIIISQRAVQYEYVPCCAFCGHTKMLWNPKRIYYVNVHRRTCKAGYLKTVSNGDMSANSKPVHITICPT